MLKPWTILSTKIIHQTPWIELKEEVCEVEGQQVTYTYTRRRDQGPTIIPEGNNGKIWLVQQYRHPIKKILWQLPSEGKTEEESWEAAAHRGVKEELHLKAHEMIDLGFSHPDPGGLEQVTRYYLARNLTPIEYHHDHQEGEIEELKVKAFALPEIDQLIQQGEICDNWTLAGLYLYQRYNPNS